MNLKLLERLLQKAGYTVRTAENGREAVDLNDGAEFDVIVMDIQMPIMGGKEAVRLIRERGHAGGQQIPIIAITAFASEEDRRECEELGVKTFLAKPIDGSHILGLIDEVLKTNRRQAQAVKGRADGTECRH